MKNNEEEAGSIKNNNLMPPALPRQVELCGKVNPKI